MSPQAAAKASPGDLAKVVQDKMLELGFVARHAEAMAVVDAILALQKDGSKKEEEAAPVAKPAAPPPAAPAPTGKKT